MTEEKSFELSPARWLSKKVYGSDMEMSTKKKTVFSIGKLIIRNY